MPIDPQVRPMLRAMRFFEALGLMPLERMPVWTARLVARGAVRNRPGEGPAVSVENRTILTAVGSIPVRIYTPAGAQRPLPVVAFFHGGGWVVGDLDSHDAVCRRLASGGRCLVVAIDYRRAPEHRFPSAVYDCHAATAWLASNARALGGDPDRLAVAGDSAGGNLAAAVALLARDRGGPKLTFQVLLYPVTDCNFETRSYVENAKGYLLDRSTMRWFWDQYVPDPALRSDAYCAPLRARSLAGLPPAFVVTAEYDPLRDEGEAYARRLRDDGVRVETRRYDGMIHGFLALGQLDASRSAFDEVCAALRAAFAGAAPAHAERVDVPRGT